MLDNREIKYLLKSYSFSQVWERFVGYWGTSLFQSFYYSIVSYFSLLLIGVFFDFYDLILFLVGYFFYIFSCLFISFLFYFFLRLLLKKNKRFEKTKKQFRISFLLPRLVIAIAYVWVAFILTDENIRLYSNMSTLSYWTTIFILLIGTFVFLTSEAKQYNPDQNISYIIRRKTFPVFAYGIAISFIFGVVHTLLGTITKIENSNSIKSEIFAKEIKNYNQKLDSLKYLENKLMQAQIKFNRAPNLNIATNTQRNLNSKGLKSTEFTKHYNILLCRYSASIFEIHSELDSQYKRKIDTTLYCKLNKEYRQILVDSILDIHEFGFKSLGDSKKDTVYLKKYIQNEIAIDSIAYLIHSEIIESKKKTEEKIGVLSEEKIESDFLRKYLYIEFKENQYIDSFKVIKDSIKIIKKNILCLNEKPDGFRTKNCSVDRLKQDLELRIKSLNIEIERQSNMIKELNRRRMMFVPLFANKNPAQNYFFSLRALLLRVVLAFAIAVIAQLIISDKTVTEPL